MSHCVYVLFLAPGATQSGFTSLLSLFLFSSVITLSSSPFPFHSRISPLDFILNFFPIWLTLSPSAFSLSASSSIATHFCSLWSVKNDRLQDEVDRICRRNGLTKWIAAFLAIHHCSEATAVKICEGAGLLITSCNYKVSDSVFVARRGGGEGGCRRVEGGMQAAVALSEILFW